MTPLISTYHLIFRVNWKWKEEKAASSLLRAEMVVCWSPLLDSESHSHSHIASELALNRCLILVWYSGMSMVLVVSCEFAAMVELVVDKMAHIDPPAQGRRPYLQRVAYCFLF
jgi:hypothetical protein